MRQRAADVCSRQAAKILQLAPRRARRSSRSHGERTGRGVRTSVFRPPVKKGRERKGGIQRAEDRKRKTERERKKERAPRPENNFSLPEIPSERTRERARVYARAIRSYSRARDRERQRCDDATGYAPRGNYRTIIVGMFGPPNISKRFARAFTVYTRFCSRARASSDLHVAACAEHEAIWQDAC